MPRLTGVGMTGNHPIGVNPGPWIMDLGLVADRPRRLDQRDPGPPSAVEFCGAVRSAESVGLANAATSVADFAARPPRQAGVIVKD